MKKSRNDQAFRDFYCCFTRESSLERNGESFQILVKRTVAVEDLVGARLRAHRVGLSIPELEALGSECDGGGSRLASLHIDALETAQALQRTFLVGSVTDVELYDLRTVALPAVGDGDTDLQRFIMPQKTALSISRVFSRCFGGVT